MAEIQTVHALHLLTDRKFLPWIKRTFTLAHWSSTYIIINPKLHNASLALDDHTLEVSSDTTGQKLILDYLERMDIAFHYFLDKVKADIIYKSNSRVIHCWCFYGAEIYQQTHLFRKEIYGPYTRRLKRLLPEIEFRYDLRKLYYTFVKRMATPIVSLRRAIPKINSILWYVEDEIKMINQKIELPAWRFFQFFSFADIIPPGTEFTNMQSKKILIGNSATIENNHVDVLEVLSQITNEHHTYSLPLTYGQFSRYASMVKSRFKLVLGERVTFLEKHLALKDYYTLLQQHPTAIFLHYRQQGLGNILYLIYSGTKVYLSERNVIYNWLLNNQIEVFNFEKDFLNDAQHNQLTLDIGTAEKNRTGLRKLLDHNRNENTIRSLESEVMTRKQRNNV